MSDKNRLRLELEATTVSDPAFPLVNIFTGRTPILSRGRDVQLEILLINQTVLDASVANISSLTVEIKPYLQPTVGPLISVTVLAAALDLTVTEADRSARAKQHATLVLTAGMTGLDMT